MKRYIADTESDGLLDELTKLHCVVLKDIDNQISYGFADQPGYPPIAEALEHMAKADLLVLHNGVKHDLPAIKKVYPTWSTKATIRDTLIMARVVWPDIKVADHKLVVSGRLPPKLRGRYSLEAFGHRLGKHKGDYKGGWETWSPAMHEYMMQDGEVTYDLWLKLLESMEAHKRKTGGKAWSGNAIEVEHRVQEIVLRQEKHGFLFDQEAALKLAGELAGRRAELQQSLQSLFPPWFKGEPGTVARDRKVWVQHPLGAVRSKRKRAKQEAAIEVGCFEHHFDGSTFSKLKLHSFNPGSRYDVADRLIKIRGWKPDEFTNDGHPKVDDAILSQLEWPEAKALAEFFMIEKRLGTVAEGKEAQLKHVKEDGRIHGQVITAGAVSGRMTHMKPNVAQTPSGKAKYGPECRACFIVPKGKKLVGVDADSAQIRGLAGYMARYDEGAYIETILRGNKEDGTDQHTLTAKALGLDPKAKCRTINGLMWPGREVGKKFFYTFIFGAADYKLGLTVGVSGDSAKVRRAGAKARRLFLTRIPALGQIVEAVGKRVEASGGLVGLDSRFLLIRKRHAALNTLLQAAEAVIMKTALVMLDDTLQAAGLKPGVNYEFVANVHDEWQIEVDEEHAEFVGKTAAASIKQAGEFYKFACPLEGNFEIGDNWRDTH